LFAFLAAEILLDEIKTEESKNSDLVYPIKINKRILKLLFLSSSDNLGLNLCTTPIKE
jgi:hypothetical protein